MTTESQAFADLILYNGRIHTVDTARPTASAVALRDGRFLAVGDDAEVFAHRGPATRLVNANGRRVIPGLNDSHMHLIRGGFNYNNALILYATLAKGPKLPFEQQVNSTRRFRRELNRLGVTSAIDAGGGFQNYPEDYLDPPTLPVLPDWSPVAIAPGHHRPMARMEHVHAPGGACAVHGCFHGAYRSAVPVGDFSGFWGALGCSCFAF